MARSELFIGTPEGHTLGNQTWYTRQKRQERFQFYCLALVGSSELQTLQLFYFTGMTARVPQIMAEKLFA